ncbi:MAG TPA: TonB-dependent receptor [Acidobacteriaceae bacterium]|nr:TonB-dependent receptor [Acidobacteriaceae bacterium]
MFLGGGCLIACAQQAASLYSGRIVGPTGAPIVGATIQLEVANHTLLLVTGDRGDFQVSTKLSGPATLVLKIQGYAPQTERLLPNQPRIINLTLATNSQRVVVTADRTSLALNESANTVRVVSQQAMQQTGNFTIGDQLRQVTGLQFFRRSSTLVANPTSQGVSLRGLGSTAASRTLVLANQVPLNDPFGGWVYWDQLPSLAIQNVEVVRGGASDLYGNSAIGGVINLIEHQPGPTAYAIDTGYGQENTPHAAVLGTTALGPWSGLAAADWLRTDGYIEVAPQDRGPVDTAANVHYQNGELDGRRTFAEHGDAYLRGNVLNEARNNGTPLQKNRNRLWRYTGGTDWTTQNAGAFAGQLFGAQEHYQQSFSSTTAGQQSEFLTRFQKVAVQQFGGSVQWTKALRPWLMLIAGADGNDVRASDDETPFKNSLPNGLADTSARQRDIGEYVEGLVQTKNWTVAAAVRGDEFFNLDTVQFMQTGNGPISTTNIPNRSEALANPRLGVVRRMDQYISLTGSVYRAFRSPTMNELYRRSQVGQAVTLPNPNLLSERATGWETGLQLSLPTRNTVVRASYFWTEVNRPVTALTISVTPTQILEQRENLGQIRSRGMSLDYASQPLSWLSITGGYQYANATVTQFVQEPSLVGKWIPQVAHNMATAQVTAAKPKIGLLTLLGTQSGRQYDDDQNTFLLHGYFQLDAYASHTFGARTEVYGAISNIFDREIDVGRTPLLTVGSPRIASIGIRFHSKGWNGGN